MFFSCGKKESTSEINIKRNISEADAQENSPVIRDPGEKISGLYKISAKEVKDYIGDSLLISGYVADLYLGEKVAYLNFENKFPKNTFSCVIFSGKFNEFGDLSKFKGKNVEVTGRISVFKGKPQTILNSPDQIKIIN
ncbi:MAG: hypothetical protein SGI89_04860 [bacterium]|nr:hypothetical protein [bacterium]